MWLLYNDLTGHSILYCKLLSHSVPWQSEGWCSLLLPPCWVGMLIRGSVAQRITVLWVCCPHPRPCRAGMLSRLGPPLTLFLSADQAQSTVQRVGIFVKSVCTLLCGWRKWRKLLWHKVVIMLAAVVARHALLCGHGFSFIYIYSTQILWRKGYCRG